MLRGEKVVLRPIERDDVEQIAGWEGDPEIWPQTSTLPYTPKSVADVLRDYDVEGSELLRSTDTEAPFAVTVDGELIGTVSLWGIDVHNRRGHLGITLGPDARGKGYGRDACRVLLGYAFRDRGLHRVQLEVLADNERALRAYAAAGFVEEGRMRDSAWVHGRFVDEVYMSVLSTDPGRPGGAP